AAWDPSLITGVYADWIDEYDPLLRFIRNQLDAGLLSQDKLLEHDTQICSQITEARAFGEASALPDPESALDGVFAA
ncbi:MAG: hypothetical protein QGH63_14300, partial [Rhodospirillales bacterium]|nr:hypothetical protein [Rhodospirillales bacterium]